MMSSHHAATHTQHSATGTVHYRTMQPHDAEAVCHLVAKVFSARVAPHFAPEGITAFLQYLRPTELWKRIHHEHFVLVAEDKSGLVGMIEMRDYNHVALLFVDEGHQKQGIARSLVELAVKACQQQNPELTEITVGATPNAVPVYARLGFQQVEPDHWENGMHTFPMVLRLTPQHAAHEMHKKA